MNIFDTIALVLGLLIVLVVIVFIIIKMSSPEERASKKQKKIQEIVITPSVPAEKKPHDLESLKKVIKNKRSTSHDLQEALDMIIKYYGEIHPKLGIRAHPDFDHYMEIIIRLCRHPKATSKMVVKFDKELREKNPDYERDINEVMAKGLNSRV